MEKRLSTPELEATEKLFMMECPECHYFITCHIKESEDHVIEITIACENCNNFMNIIPDYVTPQRGTIYYRCYRCHQGIILQTLNPNLISSYKF